MKKPNDAGGNSAPGSTITPNAGTAPVQSIQKKFQVFNFFII